MSHIARLFPIVVLTTLPFTSALPQDAADEDLRCVSVRRIDRTEVIDDRHIAFYLRNGDIYLNQLARTCPGLEFERRFSYRTTGQLCSIDMITVIEDSAFGFRNGASCGLGVFTPITEDLLDVLKGDEEEADITVTDVEIEDAEAAEEQ